MWVPAFADTERFGIGYRLTMQIQTSTNRQRLESFAKDQKNTIFSVVWITRVPEINNKAPENRLRAQKERIASQPPICRGYVSFREGNS